MDAFIFMASMVAMGWAATIESPSATVRVMTPENGAATCDGSLRLAFSRRGCLRSDGAVSHRRRA
jgi:hypothetical protein